MITRQLISQLNSLRTVHSNHAFYNYIIILESIEQQQGQPSQNETYHGRPRRPGARPPRLVPQDPHTTGHHRRSPDRDRARCASMVRAFCAPCGILSGWVEGHKGMSPRHAPVSRPRLTDWFRALAGDRSNTRLRPGLRSPRRAPRAARPSALISRCWRTRSSRRCWSCCIRGFWCVVQRRRKSVSRLVGDREMFWLWGLWRMFFCPVDLLTVNGWVW